MINILITGCAGNIGSELVRGCLDTLKLNVIGLDNLSTGSLDKISTALRNDRFKFIKCDVNCEIDVLEKIISENSITHIFHLAAVVGVKRTLENPLLVLRDIQGIEALLSLAVKFSVAHFVYASSSEVYGEPVHVPQHEWLTPLNARLPYAIVKNVGEAYVKSYNQISNLNYTICRFFNTYGPNQSDEFVVPRFLRRALSNEEITIYGDGNQTRTFCYVSDTVQALLNIIQKPQDFKNVTMNVGSDVEYTINDLANLIVLQTGSSSPIIHLPPLEEGDMRRRLPDISIMRKHMDAELVSLSDGIDKLINFWKAND